MDNYSCRYYIAWSTVTFLCFSRPDKSAIVFCSQASTFKKPQFQKFTLILFVICTAPFKNFQNITNNSFLWCCKHNYHDNNRTLAKKKNNAEEMAENQSITDYGLLVTFWTYWRKIALFPETSNSAKIIDGTVKCNRITEIAYYIKAQ